MAPEFDVTDIPEMEPVDTVPPLLPMMTCDSEPEPVFVSSGASTEPLFVPIDRSVIVPWPAATIAPELLVTDMPEMEPVEMVPVPPLLPMETWDREPEPVFVSSWASTEPLLLQMERSVIVP